MVVIFLLFFVFPRPSYSDSSLVLYKFSSDNGTDWVEVYNPLANMIDLDGYFLEDGSTSGNKKTLSCLLKSGGYYVIDWGNSLNKSGDIIYLKDSQSSLVDCVAYGDSSEVCPGKDKIDMVQLSPGEYGWWKENDWEVTGNSDKVDNSDCTSPTPTPSPSPLPTVTATPSPTLTPTPPETSATYKINKVKNGNGDFISEVKIYVDDTYIHHYDDEILTFCDGCYCDDDKQVACGFGEHTIRLEKNGYQDWTERKTINAGNNFEVNPEMDLLAPTVTPGPTSTPIKKPTLTPTTEPTATPSSQIYLDDEASQEAGITPGGNVLSASDESKPGRFSLSGLPLIFVGVGTIMIGVYFWLEKKGEYFSDETEIKDGKS